MVTKTEVKTHTMMTIQTLPSEATAIIVVETEIEIMTMRNTDAITTIDVHSLATMITTVIRKEIITDIRRSKIREQ